MIKSMTGYGRGEALLDTMNIGVELKSVNHRYFEFSARVPRAFNFLEEKLKSFFGASVSRGKVDVFVSLDAAEQPGTEVIVNHLLAAGYVKALHSLFEEYGVTNDITVTAIAKYPDVITVKKQPADEDAVWAAVESAAGAALGAFLKMRETEGEKLSADIMLRIKFILEKVEFIETRSPESAKAYREKLEQKIKDLIGDVQIDEQRLITETAIYADKIAVAEETVRLRSHMEQLAGLLDEGGAIGRKLDFIVQEMNREANTIGSKAQDMEITRAVVDIKSEIEKIREQVQNIE